ncbi:hypothetical protein K9L97_02305 [Candidatus Woesearchaeota archaeon]|nr:hypothetical protein [Candidatus Woesearchaeota archaeon]
MSKKVAKLGLKKETGYLYFIDKNGDVARAVMVRGALKGKKKKPEVVSKANIKKEAGFLYFVDKEGDVSKAKMARGRK